MVIGSKIRGLEKVKENRLRQPYFPGHILRVTARL